MKKKDAYEFWERVETDSAFREELLKAKTLEEKQKILKQQNFQFTKEEYEKAFQKRSGSELDQEQLKNLHAAGSNAAAVHQSSPVFFTQ